MKKVLIVFMILSLPLLTIAQSEMKPEIDKRLYEVFEADFLEKMQIEKPHFIQYQNFYLDNSYETIDFPKGKTSEYPIIEIDNLENLNIIQLKNKGLIKTSQDYPNFYLIKDTDKVLMILSNKDFVKKLNQHLGRKV
jgi:hypothetical protein